MALPQTPADLEQIIAQAQTPDGPLARFVAIRAAVQETKVSVSCRCWPQERYAEVRDDIRRVAMPYAGAEVRFPSEPFPAMICPERHARRLAHHPRRTVGQDMVTELRAAFPPLSGEDFALFLNRIPGTYTFLGVHTPGTPITTSCPHYPDFSPDERTIGVAVRAMAGWIAERTNRRQAQSASFPA